MLDVYTEKFTDMLGNPAQMLEVSGLPDGCLLGLRDALSSEYGDDTEILIYRSELDEAGLSILSNWVDKNAPELKKKMDSSDTIRLFEGSW